MHLEKTARTLRLNTEVRTTLFTRWLYDIIEQMASGDITNKGRRYSISTTQQYKATLDNWREFELSIGFTANTSDINKDWIEGFSRFLNAKKLSQNSVNLYVSKALAMHNLMCEKGINHNFIRRSMTSKEKTTQIALSITELSMIKNCDVTPGERFVVDLFLIGCFTGLRFAYIKKFLANKNEYIKVDNGVPLIEIVSDKTGTSSTLIIGSELKSILDKYDGNVKVPSEQYVNRTLKIVAKKAGLTDLIAKRITVGGSMTETFTPKYDMVSTHTARRTFVTLAKKHIKDNSAICKMTGHTSIATMEGYNYNTDREEVLAYASNDMFKITL